MVENLLSVTRINNETAKVNKSMESVDEVISSAVDRFKKRFPDAQLRVFPLRRRNNDYDGSSSDRAGYKQHIAERPGTRKQHEATGTQRFRRKRQGVVSHKGLRRGIDEDKIETIFDGVGYREDRQTTADGYKGMGIGLSICKTIVTAHGGKINARNHGSGSEFYFYLPKGTEE